LLVVKAPDSSSLVNQSALDQDLRIQVLVALARQVKNVLQQKLGDLPDNSTFTDIRVSTEVPFPFIWTVAKPTDRFDFSIGDEDLQNFKFHGRKTFKIILEKVRLLSLKQGHSGLWILGTKGYGKSHEMAKLAIYLLVVEKRRVVYVPDCRACAVNPVYYVQAAFILAYVDDPEAIEQIARFSSQEDITAFVHLRASRNETIYFIIDQYNALDSVGERTQKPDDLKTVTKANVRNWLLHLTSIHGIRILCSSSNHASAHELVRKDAGYLPLFLNGGYTASELVEWWKVKGSDVPKAIRSEVAAFTGRVPLLLEMVARPGHADWKKKLLPIAEEARAFSKELYAKGVQDQFKSHRQFVKGCILEVEVEGIDFPLVDHRYFFRSEDGIGHCTNMLVADTMWRWLETINPSLFTTKDFINMIASFKTNPSVGGFAVEAACLTSISKNGLPIEDVPGYKARDPIPLMFFANGLPDLLGAQNGASLYCPSAYNFPNIDAMICVKLEKPKSKPPRLATLLPIQITLDPSKHSDSEEGFFKSLDQWRSQFLATSWRIEVVFVWIGGSEEGKETIGEDKLGYSHPQFIRYTIPFKKLDPEIAEALADYSISVGSKRKTKSPKKSAKKTSKV
jgi:hypothetical protein